LEVFTMRRSARLAPLQTLLSDPALAPGNRSLPRRDRLARSGRPEPPGCDRFRLCIERDSVLAHDVQVAEE